MNKQDNQNKAVAVKRAKLLWQHYHANDGKLTTRDVKRITNKDASRLYPIFDHWEIEAPPVTNSFASKRQERVSMLWAFFAEIEREYVTTVEVGNLWGVPPKEVLKLYRVMIKHGHDLPRLHYEPRSKPAATGHREWVSAKYPAGFRYWKKTPLPDGRAIYYIK